MKIVLSVFIILVVLSNTSDGSNSSHTGHLRSLPVTRPQVSPSPRPCLFGGSRGRASGAACCLSRTCCVSYSVGSGRPAAASCACPSHPRRCPLSPCCHAHTHSFLHFLPEQAGVTAFLAFPPSFRPHPSGTAWGAAARAARPCPHPRGLAPLPSPARPPLSSPSSLSCPQGSMHSRLMAEWLPTRGSPRSGSRVGSQGAAKRGRRSAALPFPLLQLGFRAAHGRFPRVAFL